MAPTSTWVMSFPVRQRLFSALDCTLQNTLTRPQNSFQISGSQPVPSPTFSPLSLLFLPSASLTTSRLCTRPQAEHQVMAEEYRTLESVNYEVGDCDACILGASLRGSLLHEGPSSSGVIASLALCIANDCVWDRPFSLESTPSRIGSSAWFPFVRGLGLLPAVRGSLGVKLRWFGTLLSTRVLLLSRCFCLWLLFRTVRRGSFFCFFPISV